jgi:tetratricopeptide (TPR) repeat protein
VRTAVVRTCFLIAKTLSACGPAFISILKQFPTHFSALNEFGTLLARTGAIAAACRVYSEAIIHHANNPIAHVNLANLLLRATQYQEARHHYEVALKLDPDNPQAHQGMGAVLADFGEDTAARAHFEKGFKGHAIATLPYRGAKPPIRVLQPVSSGGGNIPPAYFWMTQRIRQLSLSRTIKRIWRLCLRTT